MSVVRAAFTGLILCAWGCAGAPSRLEPGARPGAAEEWVIQKDSLLLRVNAAEAYAALGVIQAPDSAARASSWKRLAGTVPYQRLKIRQHAMGVELTDSAFLAFLRSDSARRGAPELSATLESWRSSDMSGAAERAAAYLPAGTPIRASLYLVIKPRNNTFVFDTRNDPAIFVAIDPSLSAAAFQNEYAHELHHIGYTSACRGETPRAAAAEVDTLRNWIGAFGEGWAMLAAAGNPDRHPNADWSDSVRAVWDRSYANVSGDLDRLQDFFLAVLDRRIPADSIRTLGFSFFGPVQGPWYTVGYLMASTIERAWGRPALMHVLCDPIRLLLEYQEIAKAAPAGAGLPLWSAELIERLTRVANPP